MKNKRGFLLGEHTLKIVIAVLCLLLLFYLLFRLYSNSQDERNLRMAEATLDELVGKMDEAKENSPQSLILLNPEKWFIGSFIDEEKKPNQCADDCICLCTDDEPGFHLVSTDIELCNALGTCKNFQIKINKFGYQVRDSSLIGSLGGLLMSSAEELNIKYNDKEGFTITKK